jgi:hypothetical protein
VGLADSLIPQVRLEQRLLVLLIAEFLVEGFLGLLDGLRLFLDGLEAVDVGLVRLLHLRVLSDRDLVEPLVGHLLAQIGVVLGQRGEKSAAGRLRA